MNNKLSTLLTMAIATGLMAAPNLRAEESVKGQDDNSKMMTHKNKCKGVAHKDKNKCKGQKDKNSCKAKKDKNSCKGQSDDKMMKKKDKNSCKNGCGEADDKKE